MASRRGRVRSWVTAGLLVAVSATPWAFAGGDGHPAAAASDTSRAAATRHSVTFIGDSWTAGEAATDRRGYAVLTGEQLGWEYDVLGVGGSGYTRPGGGGTFDSRVARAVATHADVIVVQGTLNERHVSPAALAPAALATLRHLRADADPGTTILVLGASYSPGTPAATIDRINATVRGAAEAVRLRFVDPAAQNWTDAADPGVWADPDHPNDRGYQRIADRLEPLLRSLFTS